VCRERRSTLLACVPLLPLLASDADELRYPRGVMLRRFWCEDDEDDEEVEDDDEEGDDDAPDCLCERNNELLWPRDEADKEEDDDDDEEKEDECCRWPFLLDLDDSDILGGYFMGDP